MAIPILTAIKVGVDTAGNVVPGFLNADNNGDGRGDLSENTMPNPINMVTKGITDAGDALLSGVSGAADTLFDVADGTVNKVPVIGGVTGLATGALRAVKSAAVGVAREGEELVSAGSNLVGSVTSAMFGLHYEDTNYTQRSKAATPNDLRKAIEEQGIISGSLNWGMKQLGLSDEGKDTPGVSGKLFQTAPVYTAGYGPFAQPANHEFNPAQHMIKDESGLYEKFKHGMPGMFAPPVNPLGTGMTAQPVSHEYNPLGTGEFIKPGLTAHQTGYGSPTGPLFENPYVSPLLKGPMTDTGVEHGSMPYVGTYEPSVHTHQTGYGPMVGTGMPSYGTTDNPTQDVGRYLSEQQSRLDNSPLGRMLGQMIDATSLSRTACSATETPHTPSINEMTMM